MKTLIIILQLFILEVAGLQWGEYYYARVSPAKAFGSEELLNSNQVLMVLIDSTLVGTQHEMYYGCRVPYFRLKCDLLVDGRAYYLDRVDYINDKESIKNLTE